jgi:hypothetical protein
MMFPAYNALNSFITIDKIAETIIVINMVYNSLRSLNIINIIIIIIIDILYHANEAYNN